MIISRLRSKNYGPFKGDQSIELGEGIFSIMCEYDRDPRRSNRGGKSSFMEMVKYALFGLVREGLSEIELIYRGEAEMEVELTLLDSDGTEFTILRGRTAKNDGTLKLSGAEGSTKDDTQKLIDQRLGITGPDFLLSYFFPQEEMATFFKSKSSERKACVIRWLEKGYWVGWEKKVRDDLKFVQKKFDDNLAVVNSIPDTENERIRAEIQIKVGKEKLAELTTEADRIGGHIVDLRKTIEIKADISSLLSERSAYEDGLKAERAHLETVVRQIQRLEADVQALDRNKSFELQKRKAAHEDGLKSEKSRQETVHQLINQLGEQMKGLQKSRAEYDESVKKVAETEAALQEIPEDISELYTNALNSYNVILASILSLQKDLTSSSSFSGVCPFTRQQCDQGGSIVQYKKDLQDKLSAEDLRKVNYLKIIEVLKTKLDRRQKLGEEYRYYRSQVERVSPIEIESRMTSIQSDIGAKSKEVVEISQIIVRKQAEGQDIDRLFNEELAVKVSAIELEKKNQDIERGKIGSGIVQKEELVKKIDQKIEERKNDQELVRLRTELADWEHKQRECSAQVDQIKRDITTHENGLQSYAAQESKKKALVEENGKLSIEINELTFIAYMFSPKGIPSIQVENSLQQVEEETNLILNKMGCGIQIEFQSQKETKTWEDGCLACGEVYQKGERKHVCKRCGIPREHKKKDDLHIWVLTGGQRQLFEQDSGGGKTLIAFSFRMAIARLLQRGLNTRINSIFLDEILAALDEVNVEEIVKVILNSLRSQFGFEQVFMISHKRDVQESFENFIRIRRYDAEDCSTYERE